MVSFKVALLSVIHATHAVCWLHCRRPGLPS